MKFTLWTGSLVLAVALVAACGDDEKTNPDAAATPDAPPAPDAAPPDAGPQPSVARGDYLVNHVLACSDCHTPRLMDGSPDMTKFLSGVECFIDTDPAVGMGCLHSRNLTNDPTGLMNRSDAEIKNMFQHGMRPNGDSLFPSMPYYIFANLTDVDADSIVAYLRTVPGVSHTVPANEFPFSLAASQPPAPAFDMSLVPMPTTMDASHMNGRYLATLACLECHTVRTNAMNPASLDTTKLFAGGNDFPAALLGLPVPPFPMDIYSLNLTQDATGIMGRTAQDIATELKRGKDPMNQGICPPMPAGPMGAFGGLTDSDALDIGNYIVELAPIVNMIPNDCVAP
jgi:mono/diheme cytochrome c family protein